jgi:hypothetical protein
MSPWRPASSPWSGTGSSPGGLGAVLAAIYQVAQGGIRDFGSVSGIEAASYEVQVEQDVADRAKELLGELAGS